MNLTNNDQPAPTPSTTQTPSTATPLPTPQSQQQQQQQQQQLRKRPSTSSTKSIFHPETGVVSIWLNNLDNPHFTNVKDRSSSGTPSVDTVGEIRVCDSNSNDGASGGDGDDRGARGEADRGILIAPIGGLRQFAVCSVNEMLCDELFSASVGGVAGNGVNCGQLSLQQRKVKIFNKWQNSGLLGNPKMAQLALDWCLDKKVDALAKLHYDRVRFWC
ncbi:unnamed protein product [Ambrosiozyma monospora]|uniref:Unnamed protein product n=1 Tax=Ambrosiozyma monospora TaxID=43982 RepID=A0ACB5U5X4_AMBMO|nr:unnamed protein product [Ambrosiozyma monospora]